MTSSRNKMEETQNITLQIKSLCDELGMKIGTAESCTSGKVAAMLTNCDGASSFFQGGIVAYQNEVKCSALNVNADTIREYDVVSTQVASEMAEGVFNAIPNVDIAISTTGYVGKSMNDDIPQGTVFFKIKGMLNETSVMLDTSTFETRSDATDYVVNEIAKTLVGFLQELKNMK